MLTSHGPQGIDLQGCLVGDYLIRPLRRETSASLRSEVEAYIDVYALPARGCESDELMLLATYLLPVHVSQVHVMPPPHDVTFRPTGEIKRHALLRIRIDGMDFWVPTRTFVPYDGSPAVTTPVPWKDWGPPNLQPISYWGPPHRPPLPATAVIGVRVIHLPTLVLDFNRLDAAKDLYSPKDSAYAQRDTGLWKGRFLADDASDAALESVGLSPTSGPIYSSLEDPVPGFHRPVGCTVHIIEEEDGPKVSDYTCFLY